MESDTFEPRIKLRPTTTGDINPAKTTIKLGKRSEARNAGIIDSSYSDFIVRPRAPRTRQPQPEISNVSSVCTYGDVGVIRLAGKASEQKVKRQPKTQNITDQWDSLSHFERSNIGRTLGHLQSVESNEIHYINLDDSAENKQRLSVTKPANPKEQKFMTKRDPVENMKGGISHYSSTAFSIPELPRGKQLSFNILSTWGDPHYLGLMGIEVFDRNGHIVRLTNPENQIWACPADINVLPECNNDPRTVDNLVDGVNHTSDDLHAWLTPFTMGQDHVVTIEFDEPTTVSMIRIWNYNKSRIHSYRGARYVEIGFVEPHGIIPIFKGEIKRAIGSHSSSISEADACSECILFTTNDQILALIQKYDPIFVQAQEEKEKEVQQQLFSSFSKRHLHHGEKVSPKEIQKSPALLRNTLGSQSSAHALSEYKAAIDAVKNMKSPSSCSSPSRSLSVENDLCFPASSSSVSHSAVQANRRLPVAHVGTWTPASARDSRPSTAVGKGSLMESKAKSTSTSSSVVVASQARPCSALATRDMQAAQGSSIHVCALSSWGDRGNLMGVTGMTGMDSTLQEFALPIPDIFLGYIDEDNCIKRLGEPLSNCSADVTVNGLNLSMDENQMWIGETPKDAILVFHFEFDQEISLKGLKLWNYNTSREGSYAGVKRLKIFLDGIERNDINARKAPGEYLGSLDYGQFLSVVGGGGSIQKKLKIKQGEMYVNDAGDYVTNEGVLKRFHSHVESCDEGIAEEHCNNFAEVCLVNQQYQTLV